MTSIIVTLRNVTLIMIKYIFSIYNFKINDLQYNGQYALKCDLKTAKQLK